MNKQITYKDIVTSPQFWADVTGKVLIATISIATTMLMKEALTRMLFQPPRGNVIPFRKVP